MLLILSGLWLILDAGSSVAQPCSGPACEASAPKGQACRVFFSSATGEGTYSGNGGAEPSGCFQPSQRYGLQGWRFSAENDLQLNHINLQQTSNGLDFAFTDADAGDEAMGYAWLLPLPTNTEVRSVEAEDCAGICHVSLGPIADDAEFVLLGFSFKRTNDDGPINQISIAPVIRSPNGNGILTVDFRHEEFSYDTRIDFAMIPSSDLEGPKSTGGNYRGGSASLVGMSDTRDTVLQGFSFVFDNGPHPLETIGFELSGFGYEAWFQSKQEEDKRRSPSDPFDWDVHYVIIK